MAWIKELLCYQAHSWPLPRCAIIFYTSCGQRRARDWTLRRRPADWLTEPVDSNSHAAVGAPLAAGRTKCRIYSAPREGPWMGLITLSQNRRKQQLRVAAKQDSRTNASKQTRWSVVLLRCLQIHIVRVWWVCLSKCHTNQLSEPSTSRPRHLLPSTSQFQIGTFKDQPDLMKHQVHCTAQLYFPDINVFASLDVSQHMLSTSV